MGSADEETIAAIATAPGRGGVGVVRISGAGATGLMEALAGRRLEPRTAVFMRFRDAQGETIDEGLGLFFPAPRSFTGEDVFELHGHGGTVVLERLLRRCLELGARHATPGEFTKRAYLNGKIDLAQAEAVADLISARTEQAARSAARSLTGEFSRLVQGFQSELTELRMLLEASLDFPEEGTDFLDRVDVRGRLLGLEEAVDRAVQAGRAGQRLNEGISIILIGSPNVGKSSIINVLSGDDVAIVTPLPGTTRDLVKEQIEIDGVPVQIVDTAGLRDTQDAIEAIGIARTWQALAAADLALLVLDTAAGDELSVDVVERLPATMRRVWVHNKIDLVGRAPATAVLDGETHVWLSALTGAGLENLRRAVLDSIDSGGHETPFAAREYQLAYLLQAKAAVEAAGRVLPEAEFAAEELRLAQVALGSITGEVSADDLLGEIFGRFCIGK